MTEVLSAGAEMRDTPSNDPYVVLTLNTNEGMQQYKLSQDLARALMQELRLAI